MTRVEVNVAMLKPMGIAIGAAAVVVALVVAANIWPRRLMIPAPSAALMPSSAINAVEPNPELVRHSWERPYSVTPGLDQWGSGFLSVLSRTLDYGQELGPGVSRSDVTANLDTLVVTATIETQECDAGDIGQYRWAVEGNGTVMTLTPLGPDACTARERALAGAWVRRFPVRMGLEPGRPAESPTPP